MPLRAQAAAEGEAGQVQAAVRQLALPYPGPALYLLRGKGRAELETAARALCAAVPLSSSRSYSPPFALVGFSKEGRLGVDLERLSPTELGFARAIATPRERLLVEQEREGTERFDRLAILLWSGKEAVAKALGEPLAYEPNRLESPLVWSRFDGSPALLRRAGRYLALCLEPASGYLGWLCWSLP